MQSKVINIVKDFDWRQYIVYIAFVLLFIYFAVTLSNEGFLTTNNLMNIARQTAMISIMGVAMTFVIASKEIDLSVGSVAALSAITTALTMQAGLGMITAVIVGLATGLLIGFINGYLVTKIAIPSFLVTLAMMMIARGLAMWISGTAPIPISSESYIFLFGSGDILGIPILLVWTLIIAVLGHFVLRKTTFGRQTLAAGGNETAATFSGIRTMKIKMTVFMVSGMAAALAGMLYAGRLHAGRFTFGQGDELSVIAAVILGGTSLFGGVGTVVGTIFGSIMIGTINNALILQGLDVSQQQVIQGIIIILAVAFGRKKKKA
ncbi:inner-membrane translocator [Evansella cellulosilytica DSM 2522]|uniref:Inner-membrane translocator n=1 Tax=Evansella cellulosilytica (strain ATCC 21833 / DSM 2522 / FERM P-1141 / JCM 9156 / N-4) TaxID=649639 RepID=E6TVV3_EVAC2|nr:ABC transporter permease [Evansella cellulosilytica]ADU28662.1 inner-membrane translocator [Evansella cellulosilytica DSM 2522]